MMFSERGAGRGYRLRAHFIIQSTLSGDFDDSSDVVADAPGGGILGVLRSRLKSSRNEVARILALSDSPEV